MQYTEIVAQEKFSICPIFISNGNAHVNFEGTISKEEQYDVSLKGF